MEIINNIIENGERVGVIIKDGDETYALPMTALKSKEYAENLINSGYKLVELSIPEYTKNGDKISDLPSIDIRTLSTNERSIYGNAGDMYPPDEAAIGQFMSEVEQTKAFDHLAGPPKYTITTAEQFDAYLESISKGVPDDDFLPINYFVAPSARMNIGQVLSDGKCVDKMNILGKRRLYSGARFNKYVEWVKTTTGDNNPTPAKLAKVYMSYGLDGVNMTLISEKTDPTSVRPAAPNSGIVDEELKEIYETSSGFHVKDVALMGRYRDSEGGLLFTGDLPDTKVVYPVNEYNRRNTVFEGQLNKQAFEARHKNLNPNEYVAEAFYLPVQQDVTTWVVRDDDTNKTYNIFISDEEIAVDLANRTSLSNIRLKYWNAFGKRNPLNFNIMLDRVDWFKENLNLVREIKQLRDYADNICRKTKVQCDLTSFSILTQMGLTPGNIVRYVLEFYGALGVMQLANSNDPLDTDYYTPSEDDWIVTEQDVIDYFSSNGNPDEMTSTEYCVIKDADRKIYECTLDKSQFYRGETNVVTPERKIQIIKEIVDGSRDFGAISGGQQADDTMSTTEVYNALYAAHFILGADMDFIAAVCENFNPDLATVVVQDTTPLEIEYNGKIIKVEVPNRNRAIRAAHAEKVGHIRKQALDCDTFFYVLEVGREPSNVSGDKNEKEPDRHVGIHGFAFDRTKYSIHNTHDEDDGDQPCNIERGKYRGKQEKDNCKVEYVLETLANAWYSQEAEAGVEESAQTDVMIKSYKIAMLAVCDLGIWGQYVHFGSAKLPQVWVDNRVKFSEIAADCRREFWDTTLAVCENMVDKTDTIITTSDFDGEKEQMSEFVWRYYCTNAEITPISVVPTGSNAIAEMDLWINCYVGQLSEEPSEDGSIANYRDFYRRMGKANHILRECYFKEDTSASWVNNAEPLSNMPAVIERAGMVTVKLEPRTIYQDYALAKASSVPGDEQSEKSKYTNYIPALDKKYLTDTALHYRIAMGSPIRYYHTTNIEALKMGDDRFELFPPHPADVMYPGWYYSELGKARPRQAGDIIQYRPDVEKIIPGPNYIKKPGDTAKYHDDVYVPRPIIPRGVAIATGNRVVRANGYDASDLLLCDDLEDTDFSGKKKFDVVRGLIFDNSTQLTLEAVLTLPETSYAIRRVTGNVAYICDTNNILYRIVTL